MLKSFVYCLFLSASFAQEQLTCYRTDELSTPPSLQPPQTTLQGVRERATPVKPDGEHENSADKKEMRSIQEKLNALTQQVKDLETKNAVFSEQSNYLKQQVKDLETKNAEIRQVLLKSNQYSYTPFNGYLYESVYAGNWSWARQSCARLGGDIAMHGLKTLEERRNIKYGLNIRFDVCIGLRLNATGSNWVWVNGKPASDSEIIWGPGQPFNPGTDSSGYGYEEGYSGSEEEGDSSGFEGEHGNITDGKEYCVVIKHSSDPLQNSRAFAEFYETNSHDQEYLCERKY